MRKALHVVFGSALAFVLSPASACEVALGEYTLITESHWGVKLIVKAEGLFTVQWWAYPAGEPDKVERATYDGSWSCSGAEAVFTYQKGSVSASYGRSENYPLGIYKTEKALKFSGEPERGRYLKGYTFWPSYERVKDK